MKHCQQCNLDFPDSYRFCGSCGGGLPSSLSCRGCGELVETKWTFCTNCGRSLSEHPKDAAPSSTIPEQFEMAAATVSRPLTPRAPAPPTLTMPSSEGLSGDTRQPVEVVTGQEWYAAPDLFDEGDETTATPITRNDLFPEKVTVSTAHTQSGNGKAPPTLTMLAAYGESRTSVPGEVTPSHRLLIGLSLLVLFGVIGFGGWYWWTHRGSFAQTPVQTEATKVPAVADSASSTLTAPTDATSAERTTTGGVDDEWKKLRERRIGAKPSETKAIIAAFEDAENKYSTDYRFPYERAKLSIKGITSHHEAFGALSAAAEKAIDNARSQEMLDSLRADQDGDFYKLSHGHHEWQALVQALSSKDKRELSELHH